MTEKKETMPDNAKKRRHSKISRVKGGDPTALDKKKKGGPKE